MLTDAETDKVYLAGGIKAYERAAAGLLLRLCDEGIPVEYIPHTESKKHVWARDYMPVQREDGRFVRYVYDPDYLKDYRDYIPDCQAVCDALSLDCVRTRLVLDGGNVVRGERCVIMTDKVLRENGLFNERYVVSQLEKLLDCGVKLIPWDTHDMYGHADGMVRFIDRDTVLLNNYWDFDRTLRKQLVDALRWHGFAVEELHYGKEACSPMSWAHINFLHVKNRIFVPGLGTASDCKALEQIQGFYPGCRVMLVTGCEQLVRDGGALNCVTWTIKTDEDYVQQDETVPGEVPGEAERHKGLGERGEDNKACRDVSGNSRRASEWWLLCGPFRKEGREADIPPYRGVLLS